MQHLLHPFSGHTHWKGVPPVTSASPIEKELFDYTGEPLDVVRERMGEGIHRTARLFVEHPGSMEDFYRETDGYLYELSNNDNDPFVSYLAQKFGACMAGRHVLDYGCGIGVMAMKFAEAGLDVTACDINVQSIGFLKHRVATRCWEEQIHILAPQSALHPAKPYDLITCFHVLEHVATPRELLQSLVDCLKPGGLFCGIAPFDMIYDEFPEHIEAHRDLKLETLCEEAGLEVKGKLVHNTYRDSDVVLVQAVKPEWSDRPYEGQHGMTHNASV